MPMQQMMPGMVRLILVLYIVSIGSINDAANGYATYDAITNDVITNDAITNDAITYGYASYGNAPSRICTLTRLLYATRWILTTTNDGWISITTCIQTTHGLLTTSCHGRILITTRLCSTNGILATSRILNATRLHGSATSITCPWWKQSLSQQWWS